jgi:predicted DsbA family dithiol-disulfide isomerase
MVSAAAKAGLTFDFDKAQVGNTFDAHRLIHLGAKHGIQDAVKERLLRATFTEGEAIGDRETLVRLAADAGLDRDEAAAVLEDGSYSDDVRADEADAEELGVTAVPFFVVGGKLGIPGAQPPDVMLQALQRAWEKTHPRLEIAGDESAPGCEGDACAV